MIYINARFLTQDLTGVQRFAEQICLAMQEIRDDIVFLSPSNIQRHDIAKKINVKVIGKNSGHLWEQIDLPLYLKQKNTPLLINLGNTGPLFYKNKVITQHDVTYKRFPQSYSWQFKVLYNILIPILLRNSKVIVTVSQFSKEEIGCVYNLNRKEIHVVYNSVSSLFSSRDVKSRGEKKDTYLLVVSSTNYHKNFHGLIKEFSLLPKEINIKLKIIGGMAKSFSSAHADDLISSNNNIEFIGRVSDSELLELYANAIAFIFPSLYEGFGIPPLEAQACGCPVISSNKASMPEVLKDSVLYFNPLKHGDMADAIQKIVTEKRIRDELISRGFENIKRFSWKDSAEKLNEIIKSIT